MGLTGVSGAEALGTGEFTVEADVTTDSEDKPLTLVFTLKDANGNTIETSATLDIKASGTNEDDTTYTFTTSNVTLDFGTKKLSGMTDGETATIRVTFATPTFQTGALAGDELSLTINDMSTQGLSIDTADISTREGATAAITSVNNAINLVSTERAKLGAYQNRLEHKINSLNISAENLQAAESRIRDVDMAKEMMVFTKNNILTQAATAMLAQANQTPQTVLQLLR